MASQIYNANVDITLHGMGKCLSSPREPNNENLTEYWQSYAVVGMKGNKTIYFTQPRTRCYTEFPGREPKLVEGQGEIEVEHQSDPSDF
jgi:hypothetical protein